MKRGLFAAIYLSAVSCAFAAQETLNIDLVVNGEINSISLDIPATSAVLNKSTLKNSQIEQTSDSCSGVDASKITSEHPPGVSVQVVAAPAFEGERSFRMDLEYAELVGTNSFKDNKSCVIYVLHRLNKTSTFGLKRGQPQEVFSQKDSLNPAKNISVRAEWR